MKTNTARFEINPVAGIGVLHCNGSRLNVSYHFIFCRRHHAGGGFIFGDSKLIKRVIQNSVGWLEVEAERYMPLVIGERKDNFVPVAVLPADFAENSA